MNTLGSKTRLAIAAIASIGIGALTAVSSTTPVVGQPAPTKPDTIVITGHLANGRIIFTDVTLNGKPLKLVDPPGNAKPHLSEMAVVGPNPGSGGNCVYDSNGNEWC